MSRNGTRKTDIPKRQRKASRLTLFLKRAGIAGAVTVLLLWLVGWLVLSGAFSGAVSWTRDNFLTGMAQAGFRVENIYVEGRDHTDPDVIRTIVNVEKGDSLFLFDPHEAQMLIERISWVKSARVERVWPDTIRITVTERKPFALWQKDGKISLIDEEGEILTDKGLDAYQNMILLVGDNAPAQAPDFIELLLAEPDIYSRVEAAIWVGDRRWDLELDNKIRVKLPEDSMGEALSRLAAASARDKLLDRDLSSVDLRSPDRIILTTRPGRIEEYKASAKAEKQAI